MNKQTVLPALTECAAEAVRVTRHVDPARLAGPTPCADWDVRTLVNHLVLYTSHGLEHRALRKSLPDELTGRDFAADADWAQAYADRIERALAAWQDPAVWEGGIDLGFTAMPAPEIASLITKELAVHGWDLARATGQEFRTTEATGVLILSVVDAHAEVYRQYDGFAEPVVMSAAATPFERALANSGRDPRWSAPVTT